MDKIQKTEYSRYVDKEQAVTYERHWIIRRISDDGMLKHHPDVSEYKVFETEDQAFEYCADHGIEEVVILPFIRKNYF